MDPKSIEERKKFVSKMELEMDDELEEIRRQIAEMRGGTIIGGWVRRPEY